ncbi:transcription factor BIM2-like isoform X3 [Zingiber officinale]|uniref:transcription factor BIM2-like isoform X3 n=1 Tax=Zingiber officinale TaxID=94328 RepID=UPI001C4DA2F2|nr:transcription factor BIM2-like isoform X3 [Zingiber officinale]
MEASASRSSKGFDDEDEESSEFGRREGSSHRVDLTIKVDGKGSGTDDLPTSPRSKHSAMEQRRRNKINDRFQILCELIPHSDQKRDKASFLLEVIEYIQFLQEKVQKYESSFPGWNQENPKLMPWVKVYFRSFWKNAEYLQRALKFSYSQVNQIPIDGLPDPSQVIGSGSTHAFSEHFDEGDIPVTPTLIPNAQNQIESDATGGVQYMIDSATGCVPNMPAQAQSLWLGSSSPADCAASNEMLNGQDDLIIDEGTINASSNYSQSLLTTLSQALQSSGMDLSQVSISVQINLGKRASNKRSDTAATLSNSKGPDETALTKQAVAAAPCVARNISEESSRASKRLKAARNRKTGQSQFRCSSKDVMISITIDGDAPMS